MIIAVCVPSPREKVEVETINLPIGNVKLSFLPQNNYPLCHERNSWMGDTLPHFGRQKYFLFGLKMHLKSSKPRFR